MRYCPKCGFNIDDSAQFCMQCGTKIEIDVPSTKKRLSKGIIFSLAALLVAIVAFASYYYFFSTPSIMPHNIHWGDTYQQVLKKDHSATTPTLNDGGDYTSNGSVTNKFLNLHGFGNEISLETFYIFDTNDSLIRVLFLAHSENLPESELNKAFYTISDHYQTLTQSTPERFESLLWDKYKFEDTDISIMKLTDSAVGITLKPIE